MSEKTALFVKAMVARFPGLGPLLAEHREDNFGTILPHVFFGDVTRYIVKLEDNGSVSELRDVLDYLEEAFSVDTDEIANLISVSFLENLQREEERGGRIREMVGPLLRRELQAIG